MGANSAAKALFPGTRREILALLFGQPDRSFYLREIVERTGLGMGQVQRELKRLSEGAVLRRFERGRHVYFQAERNSPIFDELRGIVAKTVGAADTVREALLPLADKVGAALIFGSVARGEETAERDLDLLIIGDISLREVVGVLADAQVRLGREISPTVFPPEEFRDKAAGGDHFIDAVLKAEKIFLIGTENELGQLSTQ